MRTLLKTVDGVAIALGGVIAFLLTCLQFEWVKQLLSAHPKLSAFVHSAWAVPIVGVCAVVVYLTQRQLKQPSLRVTWVSLQIIPRILDVPLGVLFSEASRNVDWDVLAELTVVNESDTPVTINDFEGTLIVSKNKMPMTYVARMFDYRIHTVQAEDGERNVFLDVPALMNRVAGIALAKGIPYRGWVRFEVRQVKHLDGTKVRVNISVRDTLGGKHSAKQDKRKPVSQADHVVPVVNQH